MRARREQRNYRNGTKVWIGRYRNSHNMPHWHYDFEVILCEKGALELFCDRSRFVLHPGDFFCVESGKVHFMHAQDPATEIDMLMFDSGVTECLTGRHALVSPLAHAEPFRRYFEEVKRELTERPLFYGERTEELVRQMMVDLFRTVGAKEKTEAPVPDPLKGLLEEIDDKFEFYDLESAAKFMNMNSAYFSRLFHKLTGMTFSQYLNYVKVENAVYRLKQEKPLPVAQLATECGFNTIRNFNRIFKEYTGYSPKAMPKDYVMKESNLERDDRSRDPTFRESVLLESSD